MKLLIFIIPFLFLACGSQEFTDKEHKEFVKISGVDQKNAMKNTHKTQEKLTLQAQLDGLEAQLSHTKAMISSVEARISHHEFAGQNGMVDAAKAELLSHQAQVSALEGQIQNLNFKLNNF